MFTYPYNGPERELMLSLGMSEEDIAIAQHRSQFSWFDRSPTRIEDEFAALAESIEEAREANAFWSAIAAQMGPTQTPTRKTVAKGHIATLERQIKRRSPTFGWDIE